MTHRSCAAVLQDTRAHFCIGDLRRLVKTHISRCLIRLQNISQGSAVEHDAPPPPEGPFQALRIDSAHMAHTKCALVIVDRFSKWLSPVLQKMQRQSSGVAGRRSRTLKDKWSKAMQQHGSTAWPDLLPTVLTEIRRTPSRTTPFEALLGRPYPTAWQQPVDLSPLSGSGTDIHLDDCVQTHFYLTYRCTCRMTSSLTGTHTSISPWRTSST